MIGILTNLWFGFFQTAICLGCQKYINILTLHGCKQRLSDMWHVVILLHMKFLKHARSGSWAASHKKKVCTKNHGIIDFEWNYWKECFSLKCRPLRWLKLSFNKHQRLLYIKTESNKIPEAHFHKTELWFCLQYWQIRNCLNCWHTDHLFLCFTTAVNFLTNTL